MSISQSEIRYFELHKNNDVSDEDTDCSEQPFVGQRECRVGADRRRVAQARPQDLHLSEASGILLHGQVHELPLRRRH
jgi:hypothetical protein